MMVSSIGEDGDGGKPHPLNIAEGYYVEN